MTESAQARSGVDVLDPLHAPDSAHGRSGAFDLIFDEVFRSIAQKGRGTAAPFLAVLGPTGSGKSLLLSQIAKYLGNRSPPDAYCHIKIDLRSSALADSNQMHFDLIRKVHAQAQSHGLAIPLQISRDNARATFVSHMREILQSIDKYVMIYVDHSDYVPRYFARSLATQFRDILEKEDLYPELRRVGLVWSGAMSLFGLKQEVDSAFSMCKTIVTPTSDPAQRELLVRDQLKQRGFEAPSDFIVHTLASQTGGEPAFLDPIIRMLCDERKGRQSKAFLTRVLNQLSDPARTVIPELKEVALNVYLDQDLREIVDRLLSGSVVPCREPAVDVDQYHLKGAVVLDKGTSRAGYTFRNGLVEQFLRLLLGQPAAKQARLKDKDESGVLTFPGPLNEISELRKLEEQIVQCFDLKDATSLIVDAWSLLTECGKPVIAFCLQASKPIWFGPLSGEPVDTAPFTTASAAAEGALATRRTYFSFDEHRVSVAIPLQYDINLAAVTATVDRSRLQVGLSEMTVHHWTQFVMEFETRLITLCLSALGLHHIVEMEATTPEADAQFDPAEAFVHISCFAYDCRGNPIADAVITFERIRGGARTQLGEIRTTDDRARPASIVIPRDANENSDIEMLGSFAGRKSEPTKLNPANSWSCEFIFHVDDGEDAWKSRKRRTGWRCRHQANQPETRSTPALTCVGLREQDRRA
jgi:hypothetical protein